MFRKRSSILTALGALILLCVAAQAQEAKATRATEADEDRAVEKNFRSRVFEIKYRDPAALVKVLSPLGSSVKGKAISYNSEFKTISVRDFPENIAVMEEAIKRLDVPQPARPVIEFHVHILIATNTATNAAGQYPPELVDVIKQLQSTLNYRNYSLMSSQVLRYGGGGASPLTNKGVAELKLSRETPGSNNPIFYDYRLENVAWDESVKQAQVGLFSFVMRIPLIAGSTQSLQYENIGFNTPVSLREGEKVVVGTTSMEDKGIVVVITTRVVG